MILNTLGGLTLEGAGFGRPKPLLLLAYLALEGPTERRYLSDLFWWGAASPRGSLSTALSQLRGGVPGVVGADDVCVYGEVECDATLFFRAVEERDWLGAVELYQGPFLEGVGLHGESRELEDWMFTTRELLADRMRVALLALGETDVREGSFEDARIWAERAYEIGNTVAPPPRDLARLFALLIATNNPHAEAVRQEAAALGVELPVTVDAARGSFPVADREASMQTLPSRTTAFVGRKRELDELSWLLSEPESRFLSVIGAGGSGKTRLGLQLATMQAKTDAWAGVHFVALEALQDAGRVVTTIGDALGFRLSDDKNAASRLARVIGSSSRLIVLDNFEHLLPAAPLLSELVRACPGLRLVVTSRERLNLDEERALLLEGLGIPSAEVVSAEEALHSDAVCLFVERASRAQSDFTLEDASVVDVMRICRLVGGMPLALEMAAAWVRVLGCSEIADELGRGMHLLESSDGDRPDRHRSVRVAFEHSWDLLTPDEQQVMRAVSVFRGGFEREAATSVAGASIPLLTALIDRSLITWDGCGRYNLHPLLHQYLEEKARARPDEWTDTREQHARMYLERASAHRDAFPNTDDKRAVAEIGVDLANMLAAWEWASETRRHDLLTEGLVPIGYFFTIRGLFEQGLAWSEIDTGPEPISLLAARQSHWQAWFLNRLGRHGEAMPRNDRAIRIAERLRPDADRDLAKAVRLKGVLHLQVDPPDEIASASAYRRAFDLYEELGNAGGAATMLNRLARFAGSREKAHRMMGESLRLARASGDAAAVGTALQSLADHYRLGTGDYMAARNASEESLVNAETTGFKVRTTIALLDLGEVLVALGNTSGVKTLVERAYRNCQSLQAGTEARFRARTHNLLGHAERLEGEAERAVATYRKALGVLRSTEENIGQGIRCASLNGLARIALTRNETVEARAHAQEALDLLPPHAMVSAAFSGVLASRLKCLVHLGEALTLEAEYARAEQQLREVLRLAWQAELTPVTMEALLAVGLLRRQQGSEVEAVRLFGFVVGHPASTFELKNRADEALERLPFQVPAVHDENATLKDMYTVVMRCGRAP